MIDEVTILSTINRIAKANNFKIGEKIHEGVYYSSDNVRNISVGGCWGGRPAVLKYWNDPRMRDDAAAQVDYFNHNKSNVLLVPEIYIYERLSVNEGWVIMEKLPEGNLLESPLSEDGRKQFLTLFSEYINTSENIKQPCRPLCLVETFSAYDFHRHRIDRWVELANKTEMELTIKGEKPVLDFKQFNSYFENGMKLLRYFYENQQMVWCPHSLVRPNKIFKTNESKYYLFDFCRAGMRPQGYELAAIIWGDWIMAADWRMSYTIWKEGIIGWISCLRDIEKKLNVGIESFGGTFSRLIKAALIERVLGTILADVCANKDMSHEEKKERLRLLYKLLDDFYLIYN
ncbi:MAG: hypothetical protein ABH887_00660 [bacterium]